MFDINRRLRTIIADGLFWIAYHVEHVIVLAIEVLRRAVARFDPALYSAARRVRAVVRGSGTKESRKAVIFVLWCNGPVPDFTKSFIDAVARSAFQLVVVTNQTLSAAARDYVIARADWLIERSNLGRDFGAYKDGVNWALEQFPDLQRLIIANDSLFYLPDGLDELLAALDDERHDVVGVSEVFEHHYHIASFLISFGRGAISSPAFREFWRRYLPISTRRWAILRGEGRLSAMLVKNNMTRRVLYPASALQQPLASRFPLELNHFFSLIPQYARRELLQKWGLRADDATLADKLANVARQKSADQLASDFVEAIEAHNQMHTGGILFHRLLGLPVIKRDIVFREVYQANEVPALLSPIDEPLRSMLSQELTQRGGSETLGPFARALHRHSAV